MRRGLAIALALQVLLLGWAVGDRLLPRISGEEHRLRVRPVDPIDPFRGAYVQLDYGFDFEGGEGDGRVYVPLMPDGAGRATSSRPSGPFLRCERRDFEVRCGIESLFASQDEARRLERRLAEGAVARVKVDGAGRAVLLGLDG